MGESGSGKSTWTKQHLLKKRFSGEDIASISPEKMTGIVYLIKVNKKSLLKCKNFKGLEFLNKYEPVVELIKEES